MDSYTYIFYVTTIVLIFSNFYGIVKIRLAKRLIEHLENKAVVEYNRGYARGVADAFKKKVGEL